MYRRPVFLIIATCVSLQWTQIIADEVQKQCTQKDHITYDFPLTSDDLKHLSSGGTRFSPSTFYTTNQTWNIVLANDSDQFIVIDLQLISSRNFDVNAEWKMIIRQSGIAIQTRGLHKIYKNAGDYGLSFPIKWSDVRPQNCWIRCELDVLFEAPCDNLIIPKQVIADLQRHRLTDDFRMLYESMNSSDVTIMAGNQTLRAHKLILATRSPVLAEMLEHRKNGENYSNIIKIDNMTLAEVRGMLEFIYTDNVTNIQELAHGLLIAADRYEVRRLKAMCEEVLHQQLNATTAADLLTLAHLHHSDALEKSSLSFITDHLVEVAQTEGYRKMIEMHPTLLTQIYQSVVSKASESKQKSNIQL